VGQIGDTAQGKETNFWVATSNHRHQRGCEQINVQTVRGSETKVSGGVEVVDTSRRKRKATQVVPNGGWFNWALNVYPLLKPALNHFYPKLKGWHDSTSLLWINNNIRNDFNWAIQILDNSTGVQLLKLISWAPADASLTIFCDACPVGMGFWYPSMKIGFFSPTPAYENPNLIFYFEALCVLLAIYDAHCRTKKKGKAVL